MSQQKPSFSLRFLFVLIQLVALISMVSAQNNGLGLTQSELRERYGQDGTSFNDGKSCNRICDGRTMTCYFEFRVDMYDTMGGLCGACANHTIEDCFLDGCVTANGMKRSMITINHKMPGPAINVCKDDRVIVDVSNNLPGQELSIHWHGLHQKETPWSDGVPMVTQCPILGGTQFRYMFHARQAGTHYYHSHSGLQRTNGVIGSFTVRDPEDPNAECYDYDLPEHSVLLSDWNNFMAEEYAPGIKNQEVDPDSILINGMGIYTNQESGETKYAPIAVFYCERGKKHRFRLDNAASHNCPFELSIKNHKLKVIATDGYPIEPVDVDSVVSAAGERYDFVMDVMDHPDVDETIMTVRALDSCTYLKLQAFARIIFVDNITNYQTQNKDHEPYEDGPDYESLDYPKITLNDPHADCTRRDSYCVASLVQKGVESSVGGSLRDVDAKMLPFLFSFTSDTFRPSHYMSVGDLAMVGVVNNIAHSATPMPGLTQDDSSVKYCDSNNLPTDCAGHKICHCPHLVQLELCETYEFLLQSGGATDGKINHPIHLHGYGFQVVDMGTKDQLLTGRTGFKNSTHLPVVKDTVVVPSNGFVKVRFRACNPGYWFFHCHFEFHMHIGMSLTIKVGNDTDMVKPPPGFPTCGHSLTPVYVDENDDYEF